MVSFFRGDIVIANLDPVVGSEQGKTRPVLVIQNDVGNEFSPTTIIAPLTSKIYEKKYPFVVSISVLQKQSSILLNQIRTIDKRRISKNVGSLNLDSLRKVDSAIKVSLALS